MSEYDDRNRIVIFRNEQKRDGDKFPDYRGNLDVNGQKFDVALWIRVSKKSGLEYVSGMIEKPRERGAATRQKQSAPVAPNEEFDPNDIPF
jgi:uncharacterized protein (DUF736 family)